MNDQSIRIIVPCFNSDLTIEDCISSIFESTGIDFELFIIDDGRNNKLVSLKNKYPVHVIKTRGQEGAGRARNVGTYGFEGKILVFIDSDVRIYPDTVSSLIKPIEENLAEATVGSYLKAGGGNFCEVYKQCYSAFRYNTCGKYLKNTFWSAICAIDFGTFKKIHGFKESYSGAGPEDIEMGMELSATGARILAVPRARGVHLASLNFIKLLKNDLRKGCEDIYMHWTKKAALKYNRHVSTMEILMVFVACLIPWLLVFQPYIGFIPFCSGLLLYLILRTGFIERAFSGEGIIFFIVSFMVTYVLDIVRGCAVIIGSFYFLLDLLSSGKFKPFTKPAGPY